MTSRLQVTCILLAPNLHIKCISWSQYEHYCTISMASGWILVTVYCHVNGLYTNKRTSDGGNGNHSVLLPIILIKNKVDQMFPSSNISSMLVSILRFCIWFPISINVRLYFGAKVVTFCIIHIGNRKIFSKYHLPPPESQLTLLHVGVFS